MAFTFSNPTTIMKDHIRLLVRDTIEATAVLSDEEIAAILAARPTLTLITDRQRFLAASDAATVMFASYAQKASGQVGPLRIESSKRAEQFRALAIMYYNIGMGLAPNADAGGRNVRFAGVLVAAIEVGERVTPLFTRAFPL